jgi:hypothetical protein
MNKNNESLIYLIIPEFLETEEEILMSYDLRLDVDETIQLHQSQVKSLFITG